MASSNWLAPSLMNQGGRHQVVSLVTKHQLQLQRVGALVDSGKPSTYRLRRRQRSLKRSWNPSGFKPELLPTYHDIKSAPLAVSPGATRLGEPTPAVLQAQALRRKRDALAAQLAEARKRELRRHGYNVDTRQQHQQQQHRSQRQQHVQVRGSPSSYSHGSRDGAKRAASSRRSGLQPTQAPSSPSHEPQSGIDAAPENSPVQPPPASADTAAEAGASADGVHADEPEQPVPPPPEGEPQEAHDDDGAATPITQGSRLSNGSAAAAAAAAAPQASTATASRGRRRTNRRATPTTRSRKSRRPVRKGSRGSDGSQSAVLSRAILWSHGQLPPESASGGSRSRSSRPKSAAPRSRPRVETPSSGDSSPLFSSDMPTFPGPYQRQQLFPGSDPVERLAARKEDLERRRDALRVGMKQLRVEQHDLPPLFKELYVRFVAMLAVLPDENREALLLDLARDAGDERSRSAVNAAIPAAAWRQHQLQAAAARLAEKVEAQQAQHAQQQQQPNGVHHHHHDPESATSRRGQRRARPHTAGHARPYHDGGGAGTGAGVGAGHAATTSLAVGSGATAGFGLRSDVQQQQQQQAAPYDSNKRQSVAPSEVYSSDDDDDDEGAHHS